MPALLPEPSTPSDWVTRILVATVVQVATAVHGAQTLFVTVLFKIDPPAPKPICTPFCAAPVVEPKPVTTLRSMVALVPFSSAVMPFFCESWKEQCLILTLQTPPLPLCTKKPGPLLPALPEDSRV